MSVTFFQVNKGQAPTELKKLEKRPCNNLFWSPQGQFVVLAGLRSMNGALEFIDTKDFQVRRQRGGGCNIFFPCYFCSFFNFNFSFLIFIFIYLFFIFFRDFWLFFRFFLFFLFGVY